MISRIRSADTELTRQILKLGLLLVVLTTGAAAQSRTSTDGTTPLGIAPGSPAGSFALSDFDTINPYNGNLNFALPLVKIGGRGSAGYTMTLAISQRWTVRHQFMDQSYFVHYPGSAWWRPSPGYSPGLVIGRTVGEGSCVSGGPVMSGSLTRLTFVTPDGTEIELIDKVLHGAPTSIYCYGGNGMGQSRGNVWVTTDGSATTFISDTPIHDQITTQYTFYPSGYLLFRDGSRYRIHNGRVAWIRDSNGNKATLTYDHPQYGRVIKVTDSLNREVNITYNVSDPTYGNHDQITYKGFGGQSRMIRVAYHPLNETLRADQSLKTYSQLFGLYDFGGLEFNTTTVSSVWLPDGRRFRMYYNSYAEVARVELPTGGAFEYDWGASLLNGEANGIVSVETIFDGMQLGMPEIYRRVLTKRVYPNGGAGNAFETKVTFGQTQGQGTATSSTSVGTYDSAGNLLTLQKHYFHGNPVPSFASMIFDYPAWDHGKEYQTEQFDVVGGNPVLVRRVNNTWLTSGSWQVNPRITEIVTTLLETNEVSRQAFSYDQFNNRTDTFEYEFGSGSAGPLVRHSHTDFLVINPVNGIDYTRDDIGVHQRSLPVQHQVFDSGGVEKSRVTYEYDKYYGDNFHAALIDRPGITGHDSAFSPANTARANVTAITNYLLGTAIELSAYSQYDIAGNPVKLIDPRSTLTNIIATTLDFSDRLGAPDGEARSNSSPAELGELTTYAFPSKVINARGHEAFSQADYYLGVTVDSEDVNGSVTSAYFNDLLDRRTQLRQAVATSAARQITFTHDDANRVITTTSDLNNNNDNLLKSQTLYDGLARTTETRQYESGSNFIAVRHVPFLVEQDGSNWRAAAKSSHPFRPYLLEEPAWTTSISDALHRVIKVKSPDHAVVITAYSGVRALEADPTGKKRISKMDASGRLTDIWEVTAADGATESVSFPGFADVVAGYRTSYIYDALDHLVTVSQGSQTRTFVYDSLQRLISATYPENGTVCYGAVQGGQCQANGYDANGNLIIKTDARGIVANYGYDELNRLTSRSYQNDPSGTPAVTFTYDSTAITNGKGRLASMTSSVSTYSFSGYDPLGRAQGGTQTIGSQSYLTSYTYDLADHVKTISYPSGRTITNTFDGAGRLNSFTGNLGDNTTRTYASGISYSPFGGLSREEYGTQTPLYHKTLYNIRGQIFDKRVSSVNDTWDWNRGRLIWYYSSNHVWGGSGTDNNGNVVYAENWIPQPNQVGDQGQYLFADTYTYDALNRLSGVYDSTLDLAGGGSWTARFAQIYNYDRYGNRTINNGATWGAGINNAAFELDPANNNRLLAPGDSALPEASRRMQYDLAGNLKFDNYTGQGTRTYDAENQMTGAQASSPATYVYDGDGKRIKRIANGTETWQVYGLGGELIAEYAANAAAASPQREYGYRNGELLVVASFTTGWGAPPTIADNPLRDSQNPESFKIKAIHITQLRDAINALRAHYSLPNYPWQKPTASGGAINNSVSVSWEPIDEMRTALNDAIGAPSPPYVGGLAVNQPVLAVHIQELRDRVLGAWQSGGGVDIRWLVTDQLGTPRMVFDQTGSLANVSRHDYLPFGEELFAGTGGRTTAQGYTSSDNVRKKFTSYERDIESGLDYAQARYYSSAQGRFTSADPLLESAEVVQPQSWNRYLYVENNPLIYTDPTGLKIGDFTKQEEARHDSIISTGFDPAFGRYRGIVQIEYRPNDGSYSVSTTLNRPTAAQVDETIERLINPGDLIAQKGGRASRGGRRSSPRNDPRNWVERRDSRGWRIYEYVGPGSWRAGTGTSPPPRAQGLRFTGLVQNRPLRELTHNEIYNAFRGTGFTPSSHAIYRLKDQRTFDLGIRTLNDYAHSLNAGVRNGNISLQRDGTISVTHGRFETIVNPRTSIIVTIKPK
jgi:RHS repeat-associated protein